MITIIVITHTLIQNSVSTGGGEECISYSKISRRLNGILMFMSVNTVRQTNWLIFMTYSRSVCSLVPISFIWKLAAAC